MIVRAAPVSGVLTLCLLGLLPSGVAAQSAEEQVLDVVQRFFDAMTARDTAAMNRVLTPQGQLVAVRATPGGAAVRATPHPLYVESVAGRTTRPLERIWNPTVSVTGGLAAVSAPYDFHVDGAFSHCGADVFTLIRGDGAWKIAGIVFTVEPGACRPSPLGPPPSALRGVSEAVPTGSREISAAGLVAAFDMSTRLSDGRLRDFSPEQNHGILESTSEVDGPFGTARRFTTPSDRVHLPSSPSLDLDGPLTVALWVQMEALDLHQHIIACDDKFALWVTPANRIRFSDSRGRGVDSARPIDTGSWHSLVAVFDGWRGTEVTTASARLYLDGEALDTELVNRTGDRPPRWNPGALFATDACYIGFESHQGMVSHQTMPLRGAIDDLTIFRRALSDAEVRAHAMRP